MLAFRSIIFYSRNFVSSHTIRQPSEPKQSVVLLCKMGSCYIAAFDLKLSLTAQELTNAVRLCCITWCNIEIFPNTAVHCSKMVLMQITWRLFKRFMLPHCNMKQISVILLATRCPAAALPRRMLQEQETFRHLSLCTDLLFQNGMVEEMLAQQ